MSRFVVEIAETWKGTPRTIRIVAADTDHGGGEEVAEARARECFKRETFDIRDYWGLPAYGHEDEIRLVKEWDEPGGFYPRRQLLALVVKFCTRCTQLGNDTCAEAAAEIAERLGKTRG